MGKAAHLAARRAGAGRPTADAADRRRGRRAASPSPTRTACTPGPPPGWCSEVRRLDAASRCATDDRHRSGAGGEPEPGRDPRRARRATRSRCARRAAGRRRRWSTSSPWPATVRRGRDGDRRRRPAADRLGPAGPLPASPGIAIGPARRCATLTVDLPDDDAADAATAGERRAAAEAIARGAPRHPSAHARPHRRRDRRGRGRDLRRPPAPARRPGADRRRAAQDRGRSRRGRRVGGQPRRRSRPSGPRSPTPTCGRAPPTCALCATGCCAALGGVPSAGGRGRRRAGRPRPDPGRGGRARSDARPRPWCWRTAAPPRTQRSCCAPAASPRSSGPARRCSTMRGGHARSSSTATTGEVVVDPDESVLAEFRDRARRAAARAREPSPAPTSPPSRATARPCSSAANLGSVADARAAAAGADLAGLVRTEFCFLGRSAAPTVDEQEAAYRGDRRGDGGPPDHPAHARRRRRQAAGLPADAAGGQPVPRGARDPARAGPPRTCSPTSSTAIVRVAHDHPVDVMFPMVTTVDELLAARRRARRRRAGRRARRARRTCGSGSWWRCRRPR